MAQAPASAGANRTNCAAVKNIRLTDSDHDIDCKIDGIGVKQLKSAYVKKL